MSACEKVLVEPGSRDWLAMRSNTIGASDAPVILGLSPWQTPRELAENKLGVKEKFRHDAMFRGHELQPLVIRYHAEVSGNDLSKYEVEQMFRSKDHEWQTATIDSVLPEKNLIVEVKTTTNEDGWGTEEKPSVPVSIMPQVAHQLMVTGAYQCDVVCLIGTKKLFDALRKNVDIPTGLMMSLEWRFKTVTRNDVKHLFDSLIEAETAFYNMVCRDHKLPPPSCKVGENQDVRMASDFEQELLSDLRDAWKLKQQVDADYDNMVEAVKVAIGDGAGIIGDAGKVTHTLVIPKPKTTVDWQAVAEHAMKDMSDEDKKKLIGRHTTSGSGKSYRRFTVPHHQWKK